MSKAKIGLDGERAVEKELDKLSMKDYYIFYDSMFRHPNGNTAQIDFIVVSRFGVFIIEVKNYKGTIIKSQYKSYIVQVTPHGEFVYPNPQNQNKWHVVVVSSLLGSDRGIFPVVVFSGANSVQLGEGFITLKRLNEYITSYKKEIFTKEEFNSIVKILALSNVYLEAEREQHIKKRTKSNSDKPNK